MTSDIDDNNLCEVDYSFYKDEYIRLSKDNEKLSSSIKLQNEIAYYNGQITIMNYHIQNKSKINIIGSISFMSMKFDRDVLYNCFKDVNIEQYITNIISIIEQYNKLHYNEQINNLLQKFIQIQSNENRLEQLQQYFEDENIKKSCVLSIQRDLRSNIDKLNKDINEFNKKLSIKQRQYKHLMSDIKEKIAETKDIVITEDDSKKQYDLYKILHNIKLDDIRLGNEYNITVQLITNFRNIDYIDIKKGIDDVLEWLSDKSRIIYEIERLKNKDIEKLYEFKTKLANFIKRHKHHIIDNYYNKVDISDKLKITYKIYYKLLIMTSTDNNLDDDSIDKYERHKFLQLKYV